MRSSSLFLVDRRIATSAVGVGSVAGGDSGSGYTVIWRKIGAFKDLLGHICGMDGGGGGKSVEWKACLSGYDGHVEGGGGHGKIRSCEGRAVRGISGEGR